MSNVTYDLTENHPSLVLGKVGEIYGVRMVPVDGEGNEVIVPFYCFTEKGYKDVPHRAIPCEYTEEILKSEIERFTLFVSNTQNTHIQVLKCGKLIGLVATEKPFKPA